MELKLLKGMRENRKYTIYLFCVLFFCSVTNFCFGQDVNLCTGKYSKSINLHEFVGRELNLPMSIDYTANGIRVTELASSIGLGWNLSLGGSINRIVNAREDDFYDSCNYFGSPEEPDGNDLFTMNALGEYDCFQFQISSSVPSPLVNPRNIPSYDSFNDTWLIKLQDGTKLFFGENNCKITTSTLAQPIRSSCPSLNIISVSSWLLTKIISKNNLDEYRFVYNNFDWLNYVPKNGEGTDYGVLILKQSSYKSNEQMIKEVYHNNEKIIDFSYATREDMLFVGGTNIGNKLSSINFYNFNSTSAYKQIVLNHSYFGNLNASGSNSYLHKRLKLDSVDVKGLDSNNSSGLIYGSYKFEYNSPEQIPPITSYARDFLGLYNGKDSNLHLVESFYTFDGPVLRAFNFDKAIVGTIKKIEYPDKGYELLEYEQNALIGNYGKVLIQATDSIPAHYEFVDTKGDYADGFRIKNLKKYTSNNNLATHIEYKYSGGVIQDVYPGSQGDSYKRSSYGYRNAPNIITYDSGKIVNLDTNGNTLGFVENNFFCNNHEDAMCGRPPFQVGDIPNKGISFFLAERDNTRSGARFVSFYPENIFGVNLYDKDGTLVSKQTNLYKGYNVNQFIYYNSGYVKNNHSFYETYIGTNKLINEVIYEYDFGLLRAKTNKMPNNEYNHQFFDYIINSFNSSYIQNEINVLNENYQIISQSKDIYSIFGTRFLKSETQTAIGSNALEPKTRYNYDQDGNMIEMVNVTPIQAGQVIPNNQYESYIYGYNNRFVVAKITGAKYSDIPTANITAIKNASNQIINDANNTAMETALNALRSLPALGNAQITTTTINPVFGPTSITDPKGYTIYNEYDVFGRLALTKEKNPLGGFNILSETKFNTRPN